MPPWFTDGKSPPASTTPADVRDSLPRYWSTSPFNPGDIRWESSIAVSPTTGDIFVVAGSQAMRFADGKRHPIEVTGPKPYIYFGSQLGFSTPEAFASDGKGRIFITDRWSVEMLDESHESSEPFAGEGFWYPAAIAANFAGDVIFAADPYSNVIYRLTKGKEPRPFVGQCLALSDGKPGYPSGRCRGGNADGVGDAARLNQPSALAYDSTDDILFVADTANNEIRGVRADGTVYTLAGDCIQVSGNPNCIGMFADGKGSAARFFYPAGIAYDSKDRALYVTDKFNQAVRRVRLDGSVSTLAGGIDAKNSSGSSASTHFCFPQAIAYDPVRDRLIVDDVHDLAIREINADGVVSMLFGDSADQSSSCF